MLIHRIRIYDELPTGVPRTYEDLLQRFHEIPGCLLSHTARRCQKLGRKCPPMVQVSDVFRVEVRNGYRGYSLMCGLLCEDVRNGYRGYSLMCGLLCEDVRNGYRGNSLMCEPLVRG